MRSRQLSAGPPGLSTNIESYLLSKYRNYVRQLTNNYFVKDPELDSFVMHQSDLINLRKIVLTSPKNQQSPPPPKYKARSPR